MAESIDERIEPLLVNLNAAVRDFGKLVRAIDTQVAPVAESITDTARGAGRLVQQFEEQVPEAMDSLKGALVQAEVTLKAIEGMTEEDSVLQNEVTNALNEIRLAARAIRQLADYLDRHPEALLQGKAAGSGG